MLHKYKTDTNDTIDINTILMAMKYYDLAIGLVPKSYMLKIQSLTNEQKNVILNYPNFGIKMIDYLKEDESKSFINYTKQIIKMHNERYDGLGFPNSLKNDEIPMYVYLINIAIEWASYKLDNVSDIKILQTIKNKSGSKYHPESIKIFMDIYEQIK